MEGNKGGKTRDGGKGGKKKRGGAGERGAEKRGTEGGRWERRVGKEGGNKRQDWLQGELLTPTLHGQVQGAVFPPAVELCY